MLSYTQQNASFREVFVVSNKNFLRQLINCISPFSTSEALIAASLAVVALARKSILCSLCSIRYARLTPFTPIHLEFRGKEKREEERRNYQRRFR
mmetsp:Transcript_8944/g.26028  ORF Transcript_8944/g.26028 Transcript_8944/m.26028 type:complete len:95 (+) Transcript_8944:1089-1373(+)